MRTIQSLLPENTTAKLYISVLLNITQFVLESGQGKRCFLYDLFTAIRDQGSAVSVCQQYFILISGNMSIWASFKHADLPAIFVQVKPKYNILMYSE